MILLYYLQKYKIIFKYQIRNITGYIFRINFMENIYTFAINRKKR